MENQDSKQYDIKTIQDIVDCTNEENIDNFLIDFKKYLTTAHMLKDICELFGKTEDSNQIAENGFTWIDDNKHEGNIIIGSKK